MVWRKTKEESGYVLPGGVAERRPVSFPTITYITISKYPLVAKDGKLSQTGLRTKKKLQLHITQKSRS